MFLSVRARPLPPRPLPRLPRLMVLSVPCRMRRRRPLCVSARLSCLASAALLLLSLCFLAVCSTSAAPELTPTACPTQVVQVTGLVSARIIEPSQASSSSPEAASTKSGSSSDSHTPSVSLSHSLQTRLECRAQTTDTTMLHCMALSHASAAAPSNPTVTLCSDDSPLCASSSSSSSAPRSRRSVRSAAAASVDPRPASQCRVSN